jgi:hypothetical protein
MQRRIGAAKLAATLTDALRHSAVTWVTNIVVGMRLVFVAAVGSEEGIGIENPMPACAVRVKSAQA